MMTIKNYTSTVPASNSILLIERKLVECGANYINKEYKDGVISAMTFVVKVNDMPICFRLPARVEAIYKLLKKAKPGMTDKNCRAQAERTAWKIIYDWVCIQMTMILMEQVKFEEIFLPYVYSLKEGKSFFELIEQNGFKQLPTGI